MIVLEPNVPIITYESDKMAYVMYFGWYANFLNIIYFGQQGSYPVFTNTEVKCCTLELSMW